MVRNNRIYPTIEQIKQQRRQAIKRLKYALRAGLPHETLVDLRRTRDFYDNMYNDLRVRRQTR